MRSNMYSDQVRKCFASTVSKPSMADRLLNIIQRTIMAEGEDPSIEGKRAIASVLYNRVKSRYPDGKVTPQRLAEEAYKYKKQFHCWNGLSDDQRSDLTKIPYRPHGHAKTAPNAWNDSITVANELIKDGFVPTHSGKNFRIIDKDGNPNEKEVPWMKDMKDTFVVDNHVYGNPRTKDELIKRGTLNKPVAKVTVPKAPVKTVSATKVVPKELVVKGKS